MKKTSDDVIRKNVAFPPSMAKIVDDFRFEKRFRSESEALRFLVEKGLEAIGFPEKKGNANASATA